MDQREPRVLHIVLPGRGVSNNARNMPGKKLRKTAAARQEKERIRMYLLVASKQCGWEKIKWFKSTFVFYNSRQDLDNGEKSILDAMSGAVVVDDRYHLESHQKMLWDAHGTRTEVTIQEADPTDYGRVADRAPHGGSDAGERRTRSVPDGRFAHLPPMVARVLDPRRPLSVVPPSTSPSPSKDDVSTRD
jgi:Holliday junction resolvase RusA-like endonuclease